MKVLLVEPETQAWYVPIGLLKIAAYAKRKGHSVKLVRCNKDGYPDVGHFDRAYVTSYFTWEWKEVWKAVRYAKQHADKVFLGGIYASIMPEHAQQSGADKVIKGIIWELENIRPAYELVPECDYSIVHASRGCIRRCKFCIVWRIEGHLREKPSIKHLVYPTHKKIILFDNNILAHKYWDNIYLELRQLNKLVDFEGGVDARLLDEKKADQISKLRLHADEYTSVRLAFDDKRYRKHAEKAAKLLKERGIPGRRLMYYCLYNFEDTPDDFFERVRDILSWGCVAFPMRFQPLDALEKDKYIGKHWTQQDLKLVEDFIWRHGQGGAIPPKRHIVEIFEKAKDFYEAFNPETGKIDRRWFR